MRATERKDRNLKVLYLPLPAALHAKLKAEAALNGQTMSGYVESMIRTELNIQS